MGGNENVGYLSAFGCGVLLSTTPTHLVCPQHQHTRCVHNTNTLGVSTTPTHLVCPQHQHTRCVHNTNTLGVSTTPTHLVCPQHQCTTSNNRKQTSSLQQQYANGSKHRRQKTGSPSRLTVRGVVTITGHFQKAFSTLAHEQGRKTRHLPSRDSSSGMLSLRSATSSCSRTSVCVDIMGCIFINILAISSCSSLHTSTLIIHPHNLIVHLHTLIVHTHIHPYYTPTHPDCTPTHPDYTPTHPP